jgi:hypothetical protein
MRNRVQKFWYEHRPAPFWWGVTVACLLFAVLLYCASLKGWFSPTWLNETFEVQKNQTGKIVINTGKPRWTYLLPAVAGALGGLGALITYIFSHRQKNLQFDRGELESRFVDVQNRFAEADEKTRANAALRLAEMGKTVAPGRASTLTEQNYPFFLRACAQLSIALYMEENTLVGDAIKEALTTLIDFAKDRPSEALLNKLIEKLHTANQTAFDSLLGTLAKYSVVSGDKEMRELAPLVSSHSDEEVRLQILEFLRQRSRFEEKQRIEEQTHINSLDEQAEHEHRAMSIRQVQTKSTQLKHIRELLEHSLLSRKNISPLSLQGAYLQGAYLQMAHLQGAYLQMANLQGAKLQGAYLQEANLQLAKLRGAKLRGAYLQMAYLQGARLQGADLQEAYLQGARVAGSNLDEALDLDESWTRADFTILGGGRDDELWDKLATKYPHHLPQTNAENTPIASTTSHSSEEEQSIQMGQTQGTEE